MLELFKGWSKEELEKAKDTLRERSVPEVAEKWAKALREGLAKDLKKKPKN